MLGPYRLDDRLGRGGMGAVYAATDGRTGDRVAVKILAAHLADEPGLRSRFEDEIAVLKPLRHPGIIQLLAYGEEEGQPYFAMELVEGRSLEQLIRGGRRFSWREAVALALEVTRALKVAHDHGIIHRDLKPANLLIVDEPAGGATVKLADFGIAKVFGAAGHTADGSIVGTAEYMAPEQAAGRPLDHRADLYALGLVMFSMLTGGPPFRSRQLTEIIQRQLKEPPPRVRSLGVDLPIELDELIHRLLAKEPAARPPSALALGRLLQGILDRPERATTHDTAAGGDTDRQPRPPAAGPTSSHRGQTPTTPASPARPSEETAATVAFPATNLAATDASAGATRPDDASADAELPTAEFTAPAAQADGPEARAATAERPTREATRRAAAHPPATDAAAADTVVDRSRTSRFTTVAELDRVAREKADRSEHVQFRLQLLVAAVLVAGLAGVGYLLLKPATADDLYRRITAVATDAAGDLRDVRSEMELFLERFPADDRAAEVASLLQKIRLDALEKRARRRILSGRVLPAIEREYRAAMAKEGESPSACLVALESLAALYREPRLPAAAKPLETGGDSLPDDDRDLWLALIDRQIATLQPRADKEQTQDRLRVEATLAQARDLFAEAGGTADASRRDAAEARGRGLLESLVATFASRPHVADAVAEARQLLVERSRNTAP